MDRLWQRMVEIYGTQFTNAYGDQGGPGYETWLMGLSDIGPEQIRLGLEKAIKSGSPYAPNLTTFRGYCQDLASYGLPSPEAAYLEAAKARSPIHVNHWSHAAVYHAGADTGWFELRSSAPEKIKKTFFENYAKRVGQVMSGEYLPMPDKPALERKPEHTTPEQRRTFLDNLYRENPDLCPERHRERLGLNEQAGESQEEDFGKRMYGE